ncbi:AMP-binding protein [Glaciimonas sp. CA11.2]|uniref:AMP-binding protein n=1 Tax=Glaciimonas sp. CA11.2 TaxID=3048601 RepID=UPI002AB48EAE|nr:AMP-binding protein [Glaciimonas sp. CA11.2]MDY7547753.1 AMP-binding protein [Glaciimonas sp. CA11.2]MEB0164084.1 AMP-binding protein [Glaciimonas sp. CA11.2]
MNWNMGDMLDAVAAVVPKDRPAIIQGDTAISWQEFDERSNRMARAMIDAGLTPGDRVAFISRNHPAYLEGLAACLKARLVHVNINYRYRTDETAYVFTDCNVRAVIYQKEFVSLIAELRNSFPAILLWICIDGESNVTPGVHFEKLAEQGDPAPLGIERSSDDAFLLYTGGTTGMPKGVIWPSGNYRECQLESPLIKNRPRNLAEHIELVRTNDSPGRVIPACPLMHGAGMSSSLAELLSGGTVILLSASGFDTDELWQAVARHKATRILIVGDVFARPMLRALDALDANHKKIDLDSLRVISSAGLIWSQEIKQGLLHHLPLVSMVDIFGASEASGLGYSVTTVNATVPTGRFVPASTTVLIDEHGALLPSGKVGEGYIARSEPLPLGYFGDAKKTAEVFRIIDGKRYAVPGDWARLDEEGFMQVIGRGNLVINTGGEKVFVEEVEEALKLHPSIDDALVVGIPDERWGNIVAALVCIKPGMTFGKTADFTEVRQAMATKLAGYKIPKVLFDVTEMPRSPAGKPNYKVARELAAARLAQSLPKLKQL